MEVLQNEEKNSSSHTLPQDHCSREWPHPNCAMLPPAPALALPLGCSNGSQDNLPLS